MKKYYKSTSSIFSAPYTFMWNNCLDRHARVHTIVPGVNNEIILAIDYNVT